MREISSYIPRLAFPLDERLWSVEADVTGKDRRSGNNEHAHLARRHGHVWRDEEGVFEIDIENGTSTPGIGCPMERERWASGRLPE